MTFKVLNLNSADNLSSRFIQGGSVDRYLNRLGWWERKSFEKTSYDIVYKIDSRTEFRPDLVAFDVYQREALMWLVLQYNDIVDIYEEFTMDTILLLPTLQRVNTEILTSTANSTIIT